MKTLKIFLQNNESNDATSFYIKLMVEGLSSNFDRIEYVSDVSMISKKDVVLVITLRSIAKILRHRFNQRFIFWYQGVEPEELSLTTHNLRNTIRIKYFELLERLVFHKALFIFFVSNAMLSHYQKKYGYNKSNYMIIPCFNVPLEKDAFYMQGKYEKPTFVYAGGMMGWQCIPETLRLFHRLQELLPSASLTLLTREKEVAMSLCKKENLNLNSVSIKFVPLKDLPEELKKYKYGFLIRQDLLMNNVSTPTKFNSYMSVGIIPIISTVIHDFNDMISDVKFMVTVPVDMDFNETISQIVNLETAKINPGEIFDEYDGLFNKYYNPSKYIYQIQTIIQKYLP